ncbi:SSI family serine proteinase inhibitor [Sinomonas mesophila]|uniref:SSI family serine proteinase inhibitor n=1 Tax=Sinomonas mesophila TaxID=1531955 RepID=UPI0009841CC6|nr:SSI family serine proteinase inhibitor [Sinomonas mesophila]
MQLHARALMLATALLGLLTACALGPSTPGPSNPTPSTPSPSSSTPSTSGQPSGTQGAPTADLEVVVVSAPGEPEQRWTLQCSGAAPLPGSTHPSAAAACALLDARRDVLDPPAQNRLCTQQYGGPDVATVTGTLDGAPVDRRFSRTDGCEIADWSAAQALIGPPSGAV